jgi:hypothetical protein
MGPHEFFPGRPLLPLWGRFDAMLLQDIRDRPAPDLMAQVGECALNPRIAPLAILGRHPYHQLPDLSVHGRPSQSTAAVVFPHDQVPMPRGQGVRADDGPDLLEYSPGQLLRFRTR